MDDTRFGTRDKRGNWRPDAPLRVGPLPDFPWSARRVLVWLPGYLLPWNLAFFMLSGALWFGMTPGRETLQTLAPGWIALIFLRNSALVLALFGALELRLYIRRRQGSRFKYNGAFPADKPSDTFLFRSQAKDNVLRTFVSGLPIWTAYEAGLLWAWANGYGPWALWGEHPLWLGVFALILPLLHELHFYAIHRMIHIPVLYRLVHSVHHNSVNPSPWSSLSMHPVEHLLYWSGSLIHLLLPSHPLLAIYHLQTAGIGAVIGHIGFDKIETGPESGFDTHAYAHYLHHKYFEVNYADGGLPLDKWMGTWHDGTPEGDRKMQERFRRKKESRGG
ncbi:MAG: sterol desaturase family protein [Roseivivax sp.]|nr:sterol desaturase family protein [Roseivivax sp.]